jgi:rhamnogalacturonan endolyase
MPSQRIWAVSLMTLCFAAATASANVPGGDGDRSPVTLKKSGENYILTNSAIMVEINGPTATIQTLKFHGTDLVNKEGNHEQIYWSMDGGDDYQNPAHAICTVRVQTPDMADVGCKETYSGTEHHVFDIDIHYVLRRGATGVYAYAILSHPASYKAAAVSEWRMVWQTPEHSGKDLLEKIYVDPQRHWLMPQPDDFKTGIHMGIKEVTLFTAGPWANKMESKYSYNANYADIGTFGFASDEHKIGAWTVIGGYEYYNDGPKKNDLTALDGGMTHHFGRNHYGGTPIHVPEGENWSKIFGPFLLYANGGAPADDLWKDAQAQAATEQSAWPYAWMEGVPEYPLEKQRGAATGKLLIHDTLRPDQTAANAWIGLAQPPEGTDFQNEANNYQYWSRVLPNGTFKVPHVRPGTYTLYAFVNGEPDQFERKNITITADATTSLGDIPWEIERNGWLAWEIGTPDRDSREFKHGNDYFMPYIYKGFPLEFPNPLVFKVGQSNYSRDWNYAQSNYHPPKGDPQPWPWDIQFEMPSTLPKEGTAQLIVALAAANRAHLEVKVNGESIGTWTPENNSGNGLLRQASHMKYNLHRFPIPVSKIHSGTNKIELLQNSWKADDAYVSYDYVALDMPGQKP